MRKIKDFIKKILWYLFRIFKIDKKKIVVDCYNGKGYLDNPRLICNEIYSMDNTYKIICVVSYRVYDKVNLPKHVKKVKFNSIKSIYEHVTAKLWIGNSRKCYFTAKRKGQMYIQTWHGGIGPKKCEKDVVETLGKTYVDFAKKDAAMTDYMVAGSKWQKEIYNRCFWYDGKFIELGWPSYDIFLKNKKNEEIGLKYRKLFNIEKDKKILLYCPTFRDDLEMKYYDLNFDNLFKTFSSIDGSKWAVLIKLHPNIIDKADYFKYSSDVINASFVGDIDELEMFADIMITDYSSTMFDFALMKKPCFLYTNDYDEYVKQRDFNLSYDEMPFPIAKTQLELEKQITNFDYDNYCNRVNEYLNKLGMNTNPNSSKDIAEFILERVDKK